MINELIVSVECVAAIAILAYLTLPIKECNNCHGDGVSHNGPCPCCLGKGKRSILENWLC